MMHRLRRYDVFRFAQNDVARFTRNDAMFAQCAARHTSLGVAVIIGRSPASFAEGKHHSKNAPLSVDKSAFFVGGGRWIRTTEVSDNRFTVCPLWPLGNSPISSSRCGAGGRIRTPDLLITNQLLYQLSYTSTVSHNVKDYSIVFFECQGVFQKNS